MSDEKTDKTKDRPRKKGCLGWFWRLGLVGLVFISAFAVWFNGPGVRWLGPKLLQYAIKGAEVDSGLRIKGTLLGGLDIYDLELSSDGAISKLTIDRLETDYRFSELISGKVRGVSGEGIYLKFRILEKKDDESKPIDFSAIGKSLNNLRDLVMPVDVDVKDMRVDVEKDSKLVASIGSSSLRHELGAEEVVLHLGEVTGPDGNTLVDPQVMILWERGELTLPDLDISESAGIRDLKMFLPEDGSVSATSGIRIGDARLDLHVGKGLKEARLNLKEGILEMDKLFGALGIKPLMSGSVTSLSVDLENFYPDWTKATGTVMASANNVVFRGYKFPSLEVQADLGKGKVDVKVSGEGMGSPFVISASGEVERSGQPGNGKKGGGAPRGIKAVDGRLEIGNVPAVLGELSRIHEMKNDFADFPSSKLSGNWKLKMGDGFESVSADLELEPSDPDLSPVRLDATYRKGRVSIESFELNGVEAEGEFDFAEKEYKGTLEAEDFRSAEIAPWLKGLRMSLPGDAVASLSWQGSGKLSKGTHQGQLKDFSGSWDWKKTADTDLPRAPITVSGEIGYDWPQQVEIDSLKLQSEGQIIELTAHLKEQQLELKRFTWRDGERLLAEGNGELPIPKDFSKFDEFVSKETRPLNLKIESQVLPLRMLRPWVKGLEQIDEGATGKVSLSMLGSLSDPKVNAEVLLEDVRMAGQQNVPEVDIALKLQASDGVANISGTASTPDFEPATLNFAMPFHPQKWAKNPDSIREEKIEGQVNLPQIKLSRFRGVSNRISRLEGQADGSMKISGTVGKPEIEGSLDLSDAAFGLKDGKVPDISGVNVAVRGNRKQVTVDGSAKDLEGGWLDVNGTWELGEAQQESLGTLDFKITGKGIPVVRNDSLILRTNTDLRIDGPVESATVAGTLGILDSIFFKDIQLIPVNKPLLEPSPPKLPAITTPSNPADSIPDFFKKWSADIELKTLDPVLIRGNLGRGQVVATLRVRGQFADLQPSGSVSFEKTSLELPFTKLKLNQGTLTFSPRTGLFDPLIEFRGTANPSSYRVEIYAYGSASDPQLVMTSQPPLPQNEIMTLLATGTTTEGLADAQRAASLAGQLLLEELRRGRFLFGDQLRPLLKALDDVEFSISEKDPYSSEAYSSAELEISNRWSVSAGLGEDGDQRILATWRVRFK